MSQECRFKLVERVHNRPYQKLAGRPTSQRGGYCPTDKVVLCKPMGDTTVVVEVLISGRAAENRVIELGAFISAAGSPDPKRCRCSACAGLPLRPSQAPAYATAEPPKRARRAPSSAGLVGPALDDQAQRTFGTSILSADRNRHGLGTPKIQNKERGSIE